MNRQATKPDEQAGVPASALRCAAPDRIGVVAGSSDRRRRVGRPGTHAQALGLQHATGGAE